MTDQLDRWGTDIAKDGLALTYSICGWCAVVTLFAATFSKALFLVSASLFAVSWILHRSLSRQIARLTRFSASWPALGLFVMIVIGTFFGAFHAPSPSTNLQVYSKLLLMLMLADLLMDDIWRSRALRVLFGGMSIVILSTILNVFVDLPWSKTQNQGLGQDHSVFVDYVSQSIMTAIFSGYCMVHGINTWKINDRTYIFWSLSAILSVATIILLVQGRSGFIALTLMSIVLIFTQFPKRIRPTLTITCLLLIGIVASSIGIISERFELAIREFAGYKPFSMTSIGLRIDMWKLAWDQWMANFLFGTGAGSYSKIAYEHFGHCIHTCLHPHNQYLFLAMEYGVGALILYLGLLLTLFRIGQQSGGKYGALLMATTLIVAVDGLYNVPLWYRGQSFFLYSFLGLLIAASAREACLNTDSGVETEAA